jgi:4-amino-4-deoxy-L-arabinose transferase-like glycosyltransferase
VFTGRTALRPQFIFALAALALAAAALLHGLTSTGLIGPDEPRYAWIGREMARSGDWVTPRLWGAPWYEKPPLLYWLVALGHVAGLGDDLAPRLLTALAGALFPFAAVWLLGRFAGGETAWTAAPMLAMTGGWLGYTQVGVTDLPLAITFTSALWLGVAWLEGKTGRGGLAAAGAMLGLAVLAKGLVGVALMAPFAWFARRRWRELWPAAAAAAAVAAPWYAIMLARHGEEFWRELIVRHHFGRFATGELQHVQPFWFYAPVAIGLLFPFTPLLALAGRPVFEAGWRRVLAATVVFGFAFFSASANKLPGYLLPLIPSACALLADATLRARRPGRPIALSALLLALVPVAAAVLPGALLGGIRRAQWEGLPWAYCAAALVPAAAVWWLASRGWRTAAVALAAALMAGGVFYIKHDAAPVVDRVVSARGLWHRVRPVRDSVCIGQLHRSFRYGLRYYSDAPLPDCAAADRPIHLTQPEGRLPLLNVVRPPPR